METPLELSFRNMEPSDFVAREVEEKAAKLEQFYDRITSCHVFVEAPHRHHRKGNRYSVRIEVRVPGTELAVNNRPGDVNAHEDIHVAIRDAFNAMQRQLVRWKAQAGGDVKAHEGPLQGRVVEIDADAGFGRISANDGSLVYFHRNAVVEADFSALKTGDPVELVVRAGESEAGPQASTVRPIRPMQFVAARE